MDNCNCNPGGKTILTKDITKEIQKVIDENGKLRDQVRELVDIIKRYGLGNDLNFKCCCHGSGNINASDLVLIKEVRIEDGSLIITFNTQEGDQVVTYSIFDLFNPANYYTKLEVENKILEMLESAGVGTNASDIYEINYVVPSVNDLPNNADPMEIALVDNELEGTLTLYRKLAGIGWEENVPEGNYIYDNKVYKCADGSVSKVVNEIVKNSSSAGTQDIYFTNGDYSSYDSENPSETPNGKFNTNDNGQTAKEVDLSPLFEGIEDEMDNINKEDYRKNMDEENELLYPEYWYEVIEEEKKTQNPQYVKKDIVYAKNYYDWYAAKYFCDAEDIVTTAQKIKAIVEAFKTATENALAEEQAKPEQNQDSNLIAKYQHRIDTSLPALIAVLNDDITNASTRLEDIQDDAGDAEIIHPTEYLHLLTDWYLDNVVGVQSDARCVYYSRSLKQFIAKFTITEGGSTTTKYYKKWKNSDLWQSANGTLKSDTIYSKMFSDEFKVLEGGTVSTSTYKLTAWIIAGGIKKDLVDAFTDFGPAIKRTMERNNGKCRLHSTKIYGVTSSISISTADFPTVDFNGQGGIICRVPSGTTFPEEGQWLKEGGNPKYIIKNNPIGWFIEATNFETAIFSNVKILCPNIAVRNSTSDMCFSYSNSNLYGIHYNKQSSAPNKAIDIRFKNVEFKGCAYDMKTGGSGVIEQVVIEDWKSNETNGIFVGGVKTFIIDRADLIQGPYSSKHIIYDGDCGLAANHVVKNSRFIQDSLFNSNFIQYKTESSTIRTYSGSGATDYIYPHLRFFNCHMRVGRGMLITSPLNGFTLELENCNVLQHDKMHNNTIGFWGARNLANMKDVSILQGNAWMNLILKNCKFVVYNCVSCIDFNKVGTTYINSPATPKNSIEYIEDVHIILKDPTHYGTNAATNYHWKGTKLIARLFSGLTNAQRAKLSVVRTIKNLTSNYALADYSSPDNNTAASKANGEEYNKSIQQGFTYYNSEMAANMVCLSVDITPEDSNTTTRVWRNTITGKTYLDDNTEYPSADSGSSFDNVSAGFSYFNTLINAFVTCTEVSGGAPVWARKATAEIINPGSDPIPENGGQQQAELNP